MLSGRRLARSQASEYGTFWPLGPQSQLRDANDKAMEGSESLGYDIKKLASGTRWTQTMCQRWKISARRVVQAIRYSGCRVCQACESWAKTQAISAAGICLDMTGMPEQEAEYASSRVILMRPALLLAVYLPYGKDLYEIRQGRVV